MASKKQVARDKARKQELTAQLAAARQSISQGRQELVEKFKVKSLLGRLVAGKPKTLFAGSTLAGLVLTLLIKRPRKAKKGSGLRTTRQILLSWFLSLLKPAAKAWLVARAKKLASERISQLQQNHSGHQMPREQDRVFIDI